MTPIGFSTGCLHKAGMQANEAVRLYHCIGADAIELSFASSAELDAFSLTTTATKTLEQYKYVSIHAPWKARYDSSSYKTLDKLRYLYETTSASGIVLHPANDVDFQMIDRQGLPFLIENMDSRKKFGTTPEDFRKLAEDYRFGFVLDLQHAYEHDPSMTLAMELINAMGDRLKHMHVSGCTEMENHVPVHMAKNAENITKILDQHKNIPKILEGELPRYVDMMMRELAYTRSFER